MFLTATISLVVGLVIAAALITLCYAFILFRRVKKIKVSNERAGEIASDIHEGAMAFLLREYKVIIPFVVIVAIVLAGLGLIPSLQSVDGVGWKAAICFLIGSLFSALAGFIGMQAATRANVRTACAAEKDGMPSALRVAFSGGALLGLAIVGLGLGGLASLLLLFSSLFGVENAISIVTGYGLGCSMIALFGRVGGGIYTKAADVGADLVGKVEAGIPEDDPRNPAVIADNVGDNVGDVAGMGSDLTESYVGAIISCLSMAVAIAGEEGISSTLFLFPLIICGIGALASVLSVIFMRLRKWQKPHTALNIATYLAGVIVLIGTIITSIFLFKGAEFAWWQPVVVIASGLVAGILVGLIAEFYTSSDFEEVKHIAGESQTGSATNIISGFASGLKSTGLTILILVVAIAVAYITMGMYGIALAAVGMLSTAGITISVDAYGPVSDNAGGIAQMSEMDESVRHITDTLDAVGNTTAAIGKGFCVGSATLTSLALIVSYAFVAKIDVITLGQTGNITPFIIGILIGAMLPYLFSSMTMSSVGKSANEMIKEVRSQFKNDPGILEGKSKPNYRRCVDISTRAALREMILPGILAVVSPIVGGLLFGKVGLAGLLIGGLASAIMLGVFMANSGGAWDNAKKYVEEGHFGGKGSLTHIAAVTGDTVGDPLKDTSGPSLNILIKLMSIISLIIAPLLANFTSLWELLIG